jgi:phosphatidylserine/phosphatidylglycerophosphate/cardiolipin synthase-like enzyme
MQVKDNTGVDFNLEAMMSLARISRILMIAALLAFLALAGCSGGGGDGTVAPPEEQGETPSGTTNPAKVYDLFPGVTAHFVDQTYRTSSFTDDPKAWDPVYDLISQARSSLDIAVMRINRQAFVDALLDKSATCNIRIVTEKAYYDDPLYRPFYQQLLNPLRNNGNIEIHTDLDGEPRLMHSRFIIIDRAKVAMGSYNWGVEGSERTTGDVLVINDSRIADAFTNQFNQMFAEGKFGVHKRDATQHAFGIAGGAGQIEVYFGPTDGLNDILTSEMDASQVIIAAVQQFSDINMANRVIQWLSGVGSASPEDRIMYLTLNDIGVYGDAVENAIYDALVAGMAGGGGTGGEEGYPTGFLINQPPSNIWASVGMHLNHKFMYADHAAAGGVPSVTVSSGNWTTQGFSLDDEVMVILRGEALTTKYQYMYWFQTAHLGSELRTRDIRETAQVSLMYPFTTNMDDMRVPRDPALADLSCGFIHGRVPNFQRTFTYQDGEGNLQTMQIDLMWTIQCEYYFGGDIAGYVNPTFDENPLTNPDNNYILVVPAGRVTVTCVVTDPNGDPVTLFTPQSKVIDICPGGVRKIDFSVSSVQVEDTGGGGPGL